MNPLAALAPVISNSYTIWAASGALFVWAVLSGVVFWWRSSILVRTLKRATNQLGPSAGPTEFTAGYETFSSGMMRDPVLGNRWAEYRDTLILPTSPANPIRSTVRPNVWFNLDLARAPNVNLDLRYQAALPNLLVGAGLFFTFLGLSVALSSAGSILDGDAKARNDALRSLLNAASFKFVTSLVGLALSILYALYRKTMLKRMDAALDRFVTLLEERMPMVTSEVLQTEANILLERQTLLMETFATDISMALQQSIDQAFDQRLGDHIGPLREAIEKLSGGISNTNEKAVEGMLESFLSKLQGGASDHMHGVADSLQQLAGQLQGLQSGLSEAAVRMAQSAEAMATRMGEGAESALSRITDQMITLTDTLRTMAEQTQSAGDSAGQALANRIEAAAAGFEQSARAVAETLARAAEGLESRMGAQAEDSAKRLQQQFQDMIMELRALAEASRTAGQDSLGALVERVVGSAASFEAAAAGIAKALEKAADETGGRFGEGAERAVGRIADATEGMRTQLTALINELSASTREAGKSIQEGSAKGGSALQEALGNAGEAIVESIKEAANKVVQAGQDAGSALRTGGQDASNSITSAGDGFSSKTESLLQQITRLTQTSEAIVLRSTEFERAAKDAVEPLRSVATDLRAASQSASSAMAPLTAVVQNIGRAIEQLSGVSQRFETTQNASAQLIDSLKGATDRFAGVDQQLAKVMKELQGGLEAYSQEVARCVKETDQGLAKAVTQLHQLVNELANTIDDADIKRV
jgi:methyl-accepting chemotaxis protein